MKIDSPTFLTETTFISASVQFSSGSQKFGDTSDDIHQFTGSVSFGGPVTASSNISGSSTSTGSFGTIMNPVSNPVHLEFAAGQANFHNKGFGGKTSILGNQVSVIGNNAGTTGFLYSSNSETFQIGVTSTEKIQIVGNNGSTLFAEFTGSYAISGSSTSTGSFGKISIKNSDYGGVLEIGDTYKTKLSNPSDSFVTTLDTATDLRINVRNWDIYDNSGNDKMSLMVSSEPLIHANTGSFKIYAGATTHPEGDSGGGGGGFGFLTVGSTSNYIFASANFTDNNRAGFKLYNKTNAKSTASVEVDYTADNGLLTLKGSKISGSSTSTGSFGMVGVGVASPSEELEVAGTIKASQHIVLGQGFGLYLDGGGDTNIRSDTANEIEFNTGGSERMRLNNSGNLTVTGNITGNDVFVATNRFFRITADSSNSSGGFLFGDSSGTGGDIKFLRNADSKEILKITATGKISGSLTSTGSFGELHIADKVGIGTTSPSKPLTVAGDISGSGDISLKKSHPIITLSDLTDSGATGTFINLRAASSTRASGMLISDEASGNDRGWFGTTYNGYSLQIGQGTSPWLMASGRIHVLHQSANAGYRGNVLIGPGTPTATFPNEQLVVEGNTIINGNLEVTGSVSGSATTTGSFGQLVLTGGTWPPPTATLYVKSDAGRTAKFETTSTSANPDVHIVDADNTAGRAALQVQGNGGSNEILFADSTGKVGIGETSPDTLLHIKNTSGDNRQLKLESTVAASYVETQFKTDSREWRVGAAGSGVSNSNIFYIYDATATTHRLDIDASGNVIFGTANAKISGSATSTGSFGSAHITDKVGIGTTSPTKTLEVDGSYNLGSNAFINYDATYPYTINIENTAGVGNLTFQTGTGSTGYKSKIELQGGNTATDASITLTTADDPRMTILNSGYIGIGTVSPTVALDVSGSTNLSSRIRLAKHISGTSKILQLGADRDTTAVPFIGSESNNAFDIITNNTQRVRFDFDGKVAIGHTSPDVLLHLKDASSPAIRLEDTTNTVKSTLYSQNTNAHVGTITNHSFIIDTNNTAAITIDTSQNLTLGGNISGSSTSTGSFGAIYTKTAGKLGVGTSAPIGTITVTKGLASAPLGISASGSYLQLGKQDYGSGGLGKFMIGFGYLDTVNTHSPAYIGFEETSTTGDTKGDLTFYTRNVTTDTAPTQRMIIDEDGQVGIGETSPGYPLEVVGATGNTVAKFGENMALHMIHNAPVLGFNLYYNSGYKFGEGSSSSYGGYIALSTGTGTFKIATSNAGNAGGAATITERVTILNDGKVGIGETSPDELLHIKSSTASKPVIKLENAGDVTNGAQIHFVMSTTGEGDNDIPGTIRFKGMNSANAETEFSTIYTRNIDVTDGTEDSEMHFRTTAAGALDSTLLLKSSDAIFRGNISGSSTSTGSFGSVRLGETFELAENNDTFTLNDLANSRTYFSATTGAAITIGFGNNADITLDTVAKVVIPRATGVSGSSTSTGSFGTLNLGSTSPNIDFFAPANDPAAIRFTEGGTSLTELTYDGGHLRLKSNYANRDIFLDTPNGDLMIDSTNGNVGIGVTSPTNKLSVYNDSAATSINIGKYASGKAVAVLGTSADTNGYFQIQSYYAQGSTFGDIILNPQGGKVGIGNDNPNHELHVSGSGFVGLAVQSTGSAVGLFSDDNNGRSYVLLDDAVSGHSGFGSGTDYTSLMRQNGKTTLIAYGTTGGFEIGNYSSDEIDFITNNTRRMTIEAGGAVEVVGALSKGSGTFRIPHPVPEKKDKLDLQHSFVESPTRGDNIYRWQVEVQNNQHIIELPDYYQYLNENDMVWVNPVNHFGRGYGNVNDEQTELTITTDTDGLYNVLLIGTRKDEIATNNFKGVEVDRKVETFKGVEPPNQNMHNK